MKATIRALLAAASLFSSICCFLGTTSTGDCKQSPPPMPTQADFVAYKKVEAAIAAAAKKPGERVTSADLRGWLLAKDWLTDGKQDFTFRRWALNYSHEPYYAGDAKTFAQRAFPIGSPGPSGPASSTSTASSTPAVRKGPQITLKLRQSYSDVLGIEDPSQDIPSNKKVDDLKGALFSYTKDFRRDADIWSAQAAVLVPIIGQTGFTPNMTDWGLVSYGMIPSVSLYRVTGEPSGVSSVKNVDQLTFRVGLFSKWSVPGALIDTLTLRGFGTYQTDTDFKSSIPAGQFELEPQIFVNEYLKIGYITQLINKAPKESPGNIDWTDSSWLAYQLRFRLHLDFGSISNAGNSGATPGAFLRIGPIVDFQLKPLIDKRLSLGVSYQYLPSLVGSDANRSLLSVTSEYDVYQNIETKQSISIKGSYTWGGVDLTKQKVNTFQLGLGATF